MGKVLKIGLDIHGVIDRQPELFSYITHNLKKDNHEVHILTGSHITDEIVDELKGYGIVWDNLFSISDHHKEVGTKMWYDENDNPWIDDKEWDMTKGLYCKRNDIDLCLDDTERYGQYFETKFLYISLRGTKRPMELVEYPGITNQEDLENWIRDIFFRKNKPVISL
jgi:hypothetical protein